MSKHRSIYSPLAGRFQDLGHYPLWLDGRDDEGQPRRVPCYYGQTRALAEDMGGSLLDLAGGCVGVAVELEDGALLCVGLNDTCETLGLWYEDSQGNQHNETVTIPFRPYGEA